MPLPADDSYEAFVEWADGMEPEARDMVLELYGSSLGKRRRFIARIENMIEQYSKDKAKRCWASIRWAVAVRPYALHWLEEYAKRKELQSIAWVASNPRYDPMQDDR